MNKVTRSFMPGAVMILSLSGTTTTSQAASAAETRPSPHSQTLTHQTVKAQGEFGAFIYGEAKIQTFTGYVFIGKGWGMSDQPGAFWGKIYSPDLNKLYSKTTNFSIGCAAFCGAWFFDSTGKQLGYLLAGGPMLGGLGGSGTWS